MAKDPDPERQRRKRSLRVVRGRNAGGPKRVSDRQKRSRGGPRRPLSLRTPLVAAAVLVIVVGLGVLWTRLDPYGTSGEPRMARFPEAPAHVQPDLLYLSYLDSLARDNRAVPAVIAADDPTLARTLALRAGVPRRQVESWGLSPEPEEGNSPLTKVFRELGRRDRVVLPFYDSALWIHLRERRVHPGYLVFGRTRRAAADQVDFCAVLTAINSIQPEYTALIWRDPETGQLVHGSYDDLPQFDYFGGGRLGDDLATVYREYFQLRDQRDQKPLF